MTLNPLEIAARHRTCFHTPPKHVPAGGDDVSGNGRWRIWEYAGTKIYAPILGNGDMLSAFAGPCEYPQFWITANDFWQMESAANWEFFHDNAQAKYDPPVCLGSPRPIGRMVFSVPKLKDAGYYVWQDFLTATTNAEYTLADGNHVRMKSYVAAMENILVIEWSCEAPVEMEADFYFPDEIGCGCDQGIDFDGSARREDSLAGTFAGLIGGRPVQMKKVRRGVPSGYREFSDHVDVPVKAGFAGRFLGEETLRVTVMPDHPAVFVIPVRTLAKVSRPYEYARSRAEWITKEETAQLYRQHLLWWRDYWSVSGIEIDDPLLEEKYYLGHYMMGSLARDPDYPPNILGISTYDRMAWNGNYKINYNHQSPYLGLLAAGRFEQADTHDAPYFAMLDLAKEMSQRLLGHTGAYLPLGLGPVGMVSEPLLLYMKSPAVHGATNLIMRYRLTKDRTYARKIYPYLKSVADFWEADLVFEDGHYRVIGDGMHERVTDQDRQNGLPENPANTLGYLRAFFGFLPEIASDLGIDEDRIARWKEIEKKLSPYPTGTIRKITRNETLWKEEEAVLAEVIPEQYLDCEVFYTEEKGSHWSFHFPGNIMQIYPAGVIGLDSPKKLLETARNTVAALSAMEDGLMRLRLSRNDKKEKKDPHYYKSGAWNAGNLSCLFFPAAVRVGYDPDEIWRELHERLRVRGLPNGFIDGNPHGIENLLTAANTLQEMMLLSHEGIIRLFAVWPRETHPNASFFGLWAYGAFVVSASLKDGIVADVVIESRKGGTLCLENPWQGSSLRVTEENSGAVRNYSGERVEIPAFAGGIYRIERSMEYEIHEDAGMRK